MTSVGISVQQDPSTTVRLPLVSARRILTVWQTGLIALLGTFVLLFAGFFAARAFGINALCYDDLARQAATAGLLMLPFSLYSLTISARRSLRVVGIVGAIVALVYGALLAAVV
jgi:hypothetical protein